MAGDASGGATSWTKEVDLRPDKNIIVKIEASLDQGTGVATWRFTSLDPVTKKPLDPASLDGFLPPNAAAPEGEGSVLFTVNPRRGLETGTELRNKADIVFDYNPAITTPEWFNTLDASATGQPSSGPGRRSIQRLV